VEYLFPAHEVFSYSGYAVGDSSADLRAGFAVGEDAHAVIDGMKGHGFNITAITSLAEAREAQHILELIAGRDPQVEASEYVDTCPDAVAPIAEDRVFSFCGQVVDGHGGLHSGFIIASSANFVVSYLQSLGFVVEATVSFSDLRRTIAELEHIQRTGEPEDDTSFVNFHEAA